MNPTGASVVTERPNLGGFSTEARLVDLVDEAPTRAVFRVHDSTLDRCLTVAEDLRAKPAAYEGYCEALAFFSPPAAAFVRERVPDPPAVLSAVIRHHHPSTEAPRRVAELQSRGCHETALGFLKGWSLLDAEGFARIVPADLAAHAKQFK